MGNCEKEAIERKEFDRENRGGAKKVYIHSKNVIFCEMDPADLRLRHKERVLLIILITFN